MTDDTRKKSIGPESETRGGSEAPGTTLGHPGERAGLPEGSLSKPYLGPQGDENRDPPANAPAPVNPAVTVETARENSEKPTPDRG